VSTLCTWATALLVALVAGSVGAQPPGASVAPCATPATIDDWEIVAPESAGFDAKALCAVLDGVATGDANVHGVVVERGGRLVAELYRTGRDRPIDVLFGLWNPLPGEVEFGPETLHDTRSVSKSVVGLLFGIALHDGRVRGSSDPALALFDELADLRTPERDAIRLEHLLGMSSGLEWDEGALPNDETRLFWTADPARFVFDRRLVTAPGSAFHYNSGGTAVLAALLSRASGRSLDALVDADLFAPLLITRWEWARDLRGRPLAFTGLRMRPRDMAKLGRLVLQGGRWKGRQVVPERWIADSLRERLKTGIRIPEADGEELGYGQQWWTGRVGWKELDLAWAAAFGNGGQRIFVVPDLDLTVVTTAGEYGSARIVRTVQEIFEEIVASVVE
jgi:CubicO group peptidase (beta-lactamase class C family)